MNVDGLKQFVYQYKHGDKGSGTVGMAELIKTIQKDDNKMLSKILYNITGIIDNLNEFDLDSTDFINYKNVGKRNTNLVYYDIGFGKNTTIPDGIEKETLNEDLGQPDKEICDEIVKRKFDRFKYLGGGKNGHAYRVDNKVFKLTNDKSEVNSSVRINKKTPKFLVHIYSVSEITFKDNVVHGILQEYVDEAPEIKKYYEELNEFLINYYNTY